MLLPTIIPDDLKHYGDECQEGKELLEALVKNPKDLIPFFEHAVADETWSGKFGDFIRDTILKLTSLFINDKMSMEDSKRVLRAIRKHYAALQPFITLDIAFFIGIKHINANSMLYGTSSDVINEILRREYRYKRNKNIVIQDVPYDIMVMIDEFIKTGNINNLWRKEQNVILNVLYQATSWDMTDLMFVCEDLIRRYITQGNAFEMLKLAQENAWAHLRQSSIHFINKQHLGIRLENKGQMQLAIEFSDFKEKTLELFEPIKFLVTHLIVSLGLTQEPGFSKVLKASTKLMALDISRSFTFNDRLMDIPKDLRELDISKCEWLSTRTLKKMFQICPHLEKLTINSNVQINYQGWAELRSLKALKSLDISRCHQVNDEDFKVILQACKGVISFSLEELKKLTDRSFYELARSVPKLTSLSLARCEISDSMLIELAVHCRNLISLNVTRCPHVTERGVVEAVRHAHNLRELNIAHCPIPKASIDEIKKLNPYLKISD